MPDIDFPDDEINLLDYWRVLVKRKMLLIMIVFLAGIGSIIVALQLPKIYSATTSLLPPLEGGGGAGLLASQLPGGLVGGLASGILGSKSPAALWMGILSSRTVHDKIVEQFDLETVYEAESTSKARQKLEGVVKISKSKEGILSISVEDQDPERAAAMANAFVRELDQMNQNILTTSGGRMRAFVEGRLIDASAALAESENALKAFQEKNGAVKLDAQSTAIIGAIGTLRGEVMAKEIGLKILLSYATPENPQARILKTEVKELKQALKTLERGEPASDSDHTGIFIPPSRLPDLGLKYARLLRNAKIHEALFELLTQQYEMARIEEAKDSSTVQVLDVALPSFEHIKPKKSLIVILSTFTAGFFGVFLVFFLEYLENAKARLNRDVLQEVNADA